VMEQYSTLSRQPALKGVREAGYGMLAAETESIAGKTISVIDLCAVGW